MKGILELFYKITQRYVSEDSEIHGQFHENFELQTERRT